MNQAQNQVPGSILCLELEPEPEPEPEAGLFLRGKTRLELGANMRLTSSYWNQDWFSELELESELDLELVSLPFMCGTRTVLFFGFRVLLRTRTKGSL
jgi:hypothetical protein